VATAVDDRGGRRSGGKRRQRKRADRVKVRSPIIDDAPPKPADDLEALAAAVALMAAAPEPAAPSSAGGNGYEPAFAPAELLPLTEQPPPQEFTDLLGQAVGLRIDSVSREFGRGDEMHVTALKDISIQIGPGEFVSIVGPSGCGKTCLLYTSPSPRDLSTSRMPSSA